MNTQQVCERCQVPLGLPGTGPTHRLGPRRSGRYVHERCPPKRERIVLRELYTWKKEPSDDEA